MSPPKWRQFCVGLNVLIKCPSFRKIRLYFESKDYDDCLNIEQLDHK